MNNPTPNLHSQLYYTVPVNVKITTVAPNSWQHLTFMFQYCGTPTYYMNLLVQGVLASPPLVVSGTGGSSLTQTFTPAQYSLVNMPFIDNVSLKQVPTPLLNFTVTANPPSTVCSNPVTLTAIPWPYIPCNMTYTWAPINVTGNPVTVGPGVTTTYVVSGVSTTCHIARKGQVTVIALPSGDPPSCRIEPQKTPPPSGSPATERR